jgi:hypothetical protein
MSDEREAVTYGCEHGCPECPLLQARVQELQGLLIAARRSLDRATKRERERAPDAGKCAECGTTDDNHLEACTRPPAEPDAGKVRRWKWVKWGTLTRADVDEHNALCDELEQARLDYSILSDDYKQLKIDNARLRRAVRELDKEG